MELALYSHPLLRQRVWDNPITFFGYHFHHSTFGLGFVVFGLEKPMAQSLENILLIGIGIGIILMHTINEGRFVFAEKNEAGQAIKEQKA